MDGASFLLVALIAALAYASWGRAGMTSKKPAQAQKKARKGIKQVLSSPADERQQVAVLPWRLKENGLEILLVSSRDTGRWIIPKGWPMTGRKNSAAAAIEAPRTLPRGRP